MEFSDFVQLFSH